MEPVAGEQGFGRRLAGTGKEKGRTEEFDENETAKGEGFGVGRLRIRWRQQGERCVGRRGGADHKALALGRAAQTAVETELVHVRDNGPRGNDGGGAIAGEEGGGQVIEALLHGRAGRTLARLWIVEARADVLELAENLRHAVRAGAEVAEGEVRAAGVAALPRAGEFVLLGEGVAAVWRYTLSRIAPRLNETTSDKGRLRLRLRKRLAIRPQAQARFQSGGLGRGLERLILIVPDGEQKVFVEQRRRYGHIPEAFLTFLYM